MPSNYLTSDPIQGQIDLDDKFITDAWLVDQFVGGTLFTCGAGNPYGTLGNGTTVNYSSPIQIGSLTNWKQISVSQSNMTAVKTDGTLWTWGYNTYGQLGNGTTVAYSSPIQIGTGTNWKEVLSGNFSTFAIKNDGTIWTCGYNDAGQLGNGTIVYYSSPIQIGSLTNWKQVAFYTKHTVAIKTDGTLWGWGDNTYGNLGNGRQFIKYSSPIQIGSLTDWKQVSCGPTFTLAIKTDNSLWGWGRNNIGQLGNGTSEDYSSPIQIGSLTNWKQVSCGYHGVAIKTDGTLWAWGYNIYGNLGNGNTITYSSPIQVGALTNWKTLSSKNSYVTSAIKTDGTLWTWGLNSSGQLGNGTTSYYSSPIQIGSLTNWKQVSAGNINVSAITYKDIG